MSSRQPAKVNKSNAPIEMANLFFNFSHLFGIEFLQKLPGLDEIEFGIIGFNAKKETVHRCARRKRRHVEHWMIRHGELVHRKHSDHGTEGCQQDGAFESNWYESRPAHKRSPANVVRVRDDRDPPQQGEPAYAARQSSGQDHGRNPVARETDRFRQPIDRQWSVSIHFAIPRGVGAMSRREQMLGRFELRHEAVDAMTIPKRFVHISPRAPVWVNPLRFAVPGDAAPRAPRRSRSTAVSVRTESSA